MSATEQILRRVQDYDSRCIPPDLRYVPRKLAMEALAESSEYAYHFRPTGGKDFSLRIFGLPVADQCPYCGRLRIQEERCRSCGAP